MSCRPEKKSPWRPLGVLLGNRRVLLLGTAAFASAVMLAAHWLPLKYTGTALLGLQVVPHGDGGSSREGADLGACAEVLLRDVAGPMALAEAVEGLGLVSANAGADDGGSAAQAARARATVLEGLEAGLQVQTEPRSGSPTLLRVSLTHRDSRLAEAVPNALVTNYVKRDYSRTSAGLKARREFIAGQIGEARNRLDRLIAQQTEFETVHADLLGASPAALQMGIQQNRSEIADAGRSQDPARSTIARLQELKKGRQDSDSGGRAALVVTQPNPELVAIEAEHAGLRRELDEALNVRGMTENHPKVKALRLKLAEVEGRRRNIAAEVVKEKMYPAQPDADSLGGEIVAAQAALDAAAAREQRARAQLVELEDRLASLPPVRNAHERLMKEQEALLGEVSDWQGRLREADVALASADEALQARLDSIHPAGRQLQPSWPSLTGVLGLAVSLGLLCGVSLTFLSEALPSRIARADQAERWLGMPVRGVVGEIPGPTQGKTRRAARRLLRPVVSLMAVAALVCSGLSLALRLG